MLTEAMKIVSETLMKNHVYEFKEELRKQKEGGAIGINLTGELAKIYMTWWDKELIAKLEEIGIDPILYKRYVDDIVIAVKKIIEESRQDEEDDESTIEKIRKIGESIHQSIKLTKETPSEHEDKKLPVLDLKTWVEKVEIEGEEKHQILHQFYMKEVSSKAVIHRNAALSIKNKRTILTQECIRVIRNCHNLIGEQKRAEHLTYYMKRLQVAGYDKSFRAQILRTALAATNKMRADEREGKRPMYRARTWRRAERRKEKQLKARDWYKKGGNESVMFITATPNSELKELLQKEIDKSKFKIKVVEKSGKKIVRHLQKNNPFAGKGCGESDCMVCTGSKSGSCRETGITYTIDCIGNQEEQDTGTEETTQRSKCTGIYNGETGRNAYTRGMKHQDDYNKKIEGSAMWKHCIAHHGGVEQQFEMGVKDRVRNDATKRQILEAIRIERTEQGNRMNSRGEWGANRVPRIDIVRE